MCSFSVRHRSQLRLPFLYEGAFARISHFRLGSGPKSLSHTWWESVDEVFSFSVRKVCMWDVYLCLKLPVLPMYFLGGFSSVVTWYITSSWLQWPLSGHLALRFFWQSHGFFSSAAGLFWLSSFELCDWMMAFTFFVQL